MPSKLGCVNSLIAAFDLLLRVARVGFFALAALVAVVSTIDWLVLTRRIAPFSAVARFFRRSVDPVFAPVERQLVRAGGLPTGAPWWALAGVILGGIVVLSLLGFIRSQLINIAQSLNSGPSGFFRLIVAWTFQILQIALVVRVISSWFGASAYSKWIRWSYTLSEPILRRLRSVVPTIGTIDVTPIIAFVLLAVLQSFLLSLI